MDSQEIAAVPAKPSNRTSYLVLLGTIVAGSALLYNRIRAQQNTFALRELQEPSSNGYHPPSTNGATATIYGTTNGSYSATPITDTSHLLSAPKAYTNTPAYAPVAPTVTVTRATFGGTMGDVRNEVEGQIRETPVAEPKDKEEGTNWRTMAYELAETLLLTLFIFVLMRTFIINYRIEGSSMEPNLHEGQHLIVSKAEYYVGGPERGDVIVFEYPYSLPDDQKDYIKRVIGLPGDTVECRPNEIVVNGQVIEENFNPNPWSYTCSPTTLKENEYFVLGDNRSASSDSHQWGVLERKFIIGKAYLAYWPLDNLEIVPNTDIIAPEPSNPVAQN